MPTMKQDLNQLMNNMSHLSVNETPLESPESRRSSRSSLSRELNHPNTNIMMMKGNLNSASRPVKFVKPPLPVLRSSVTPELKHTLSLYEQYMQKIYYSGYIYRSTPDEGNVPCYAEIQGPQFMLWEKNGGDPFICIPITAAQVRIVDHVLSIEVTGDTICLVDDKALMNWACAIHLARFEYAKLSQIYTHAYLSHHSLGKLVKKMEGYLDVCFDGGEYKTYWAVVKEEKKKRLFGTKKVKSSGYMMLYEDKKSKSPQYTFEQVTHVYLLCPESIDTPSTLKVEGDYSMSIMTKELVKWTMCLLDTFGLYGRPSALINDPTNVQSLVFGDTAPSPRLFLELSDMNLNKEPDNDDFTRILMNKMSRPQALNQPSSRSTVYSSQPSQASRSQMPTYKVYDSDESDEGEEEEEEDDDSDDNYIPSIKRPVSGSKSTSTRASSASLQRAPASSRSSLSSNSQTGSESIMSGSSSKHRSVESMRKQRPRPRATRTQVSLSSEEGQHQEHNDSDSFSHPQQWEGDAYDEDSMGPSIPPLGDHFATQNSLLDTYRPSGPSAHDQEDYARATGQPLIHVPQKQSAPRAGLVGMISQIEQEKKQKDPKRRDRYMQQPMMGQNVMMYPQMVPVMMNQPMMYSPMMQHPSMMQSPAMMQNPVMQMSNGSMASLQMMPTMMDPRMSMMMMPPYGQYPMQPPSRGNRR